MSKKMIFYIAVITTLTGSCTAVKPYQKMYLNDAEMELHGRRVEKTETSFHLYREGASGANGGKTGGGCGCN
jgi:Domain of unknown function (DUF4266)